MKSKQVKRLSKKASNNLNHQHKEKNNGSSTYNIRKPLCF